MAEMALECGLVDSEWTGRNGVCQVGGGGRVGGPLRRGEAIDGSGRSAAGMEGVVSLSLPGIFAVNFASSRRAARAKIRTPVGRGTPPPPGDRAPVDAGPWIVCRSSVVEGSGI